MFDVIPCLVRRDDSDQPATVAVNRGRLRRGVSAGIRPFSSGKTRFTNFFENTARPVENDRFEGDTADIRFTVR